MSSFTGAVLLSSTAEPTSIPSVSPPDEVGLGPCVRFATATSAVTCRKRVVHPDDVGERQYWPAWGGQGWVCFAGRLDGRSLLASALELETADGVPNGVLACRAVERWGEDAGRHLRGDFALAAWHETERRLILTGDPLGMRVLYYCRQGDLLLFASTVRALLAMPRVPRALNERYIVDFMARNIADEDDATFYRDIRKAVPGTCTVITTDAIRTVVTYRFDPERRIRLKDDGAYLDAARELLDQAVADRIRSVAPVPIAASGGLDSACLGVSVRAQQRPVTLLTLISEPGLPQYVRPNSRYLDEQSLVEALAAVLGARAEFHPPLPGTDWSPASSLFFTIAGVPMRDPCGLACFEAVNNRAATLGARSILTGGGGNVTLTWNGLGSLPDMVRQGRFLTYARELTAFCGGRPRHLAGMIKHHLIPLLLGPQYRLRDLNSYTAITPEALGSFKTLERMRQTGNDPGFIFPGNSRRNRIRLLNRGRNGMAELTAMIRARHGVTHFLPMIDTRIIEFSLAIPNDQYLRNGTDRFLARRLLRTAGIPPAITENRLRGAQHPEWFAHKNLIRPSLPAQIERLRRSPTVQRLLDLDRLSRIVQNWPANEVAAEYQRNDLDVVLTCALTVGTFIAWAEGTEARLPEAMP